MCMQSNEMTFNERIGNSNSINRPSSLRSSSIAARERYNDLQPEETVNVTIKMIQQKSSANNQSKILCTPSPQQAMPSQFRFSGTGANAAMHPNGRTDFKLGITEIEEESELIGRKPTTSFKAYRGDGR